MSVPLACIRCRAKKIRCDARTPSCTACQRAEEECLIADLLTNRQYKRGYIEALQARIVYLESVLRGGADVSLSPGTMIDATNEYHASDAMGMDLSADQEAVSPNAEPESLSKFLGEASGVKLARLIVGTVRQPMTQFDIRRTSASPPEASEMVNDLALVQPNPLPARLVADQLLKSYLKGPHTVHPFLQVSEVAETCDRVYGSSSAAAMDLFRLNMIFAIGSVSLTRVGLHESPILGYYAAAMVHIKGALRLNGVEAIQNILLVLIFRIYYHTSGPSVWDLSRLAIRIGMEDGLHLEPTNPLTPMQHQMRRRVFWDCYILDRRSSQMLGRPFAIEDEDIELELPRDLDDNEIEPDVISSTRLRTGPSSQAVFLHLIRMRQITSQVRRAQSALTLESEIDVMRLEELHTALKAWRSSAPVFPDPRSMYQMPEWFDLSFYTEVLALFRPLLSRDRPEIISRCLESSLGLISAYSDIFNSKQSLYTWTYVYALYTAGLCCVFCIMASDPGTFDAAEVKAGLNRCHKTLEEIATNWGTISRHAESISILGTEVIKALDKHPDNVWRELEDTTMNGFNETMGSLNEIWNSMDQDALLMNMMGVSSSSTLDVRSGFFSSMSFDETLGDFTPETYSELFQFGL